nr:hypothetical protein [Streptomyces chryseus]
MGLSTPRPVMASNAGSNGALLSTPPPITQLAGKPSPCRGRTRWPSRGSSLTGGNAAGNAAGKPAEARAARASTSVQAAEKSSGSSEVNSHLVSSRCS